MTAPSVIPFTDDPAYYEWISYELNLERIAALAFPWNVLETVGLGDSPIRRFVIRFVSAAIVIGILRQFA